MTRARAMIAGAVAVALAVATTEFVLGLLPGSGSLFIAVGNVVIEATPGPVVRFAIDTFGRANRLVLLASMTIVMAGIGATIAITSLRRPVVTPVGFAVFGMAGALAGLDDAAMTATSAVPASAAGVVAGAVVLRRTLMVIASDTANGTATPDPQVATVDRPPRDAMATRRRFLTWTASSAAAAGVLLTTEIGRASCRERV